MWQVILSWISSPELRVLTKKSPLSLSSPQKLPFWRMNPAAPVPVPVVLSIQPLRAVQKHYEFQHPNCTTKVWPQTPGEMGPFFCLLGFVFFGIQSQRHLPYFCLDVIWTGWWFQGKKTKHNYMVETRTSQDDMIMTFDPEFPKNAFLSCHCWNPGRGGNSLASQISKV